MVVPGRTLWRASDAVSSVHSAEPSGAGGAFIDRPDGFVLPVMPLQSDFLISPMKASKFSYSSANSTRTTFLDKHRLRSCLTIPLSFILRQKASFEKPDTVTSKTVTRPSLSSRIS